LKAYKIFLDGWKKVASFLALFCILGIIVIMLSELILRNLVNTSFHWSTEMNGFLFMWMAFMGIIILIHDDRLILLDMVYTRVPEGVRMVFWYLTKIAEIFLGVCMVLSYIKMYPVLATSKFSTMQWLTKSWHFLPDAIAGCYMALDALYKILGRLTKMEGIKV
jgi:TRAP-type C4-dicarboxylate transport system permease small subunit